MTNQFAKTISRVQKIAGFDSVAQAMQFAKTPTFIEFGTMQWDIWHAEKKQFFSSLFQKNPLAACLCYALSDSMMEAIDTNDFSYVYENNKDERFARWFDMFLDDFSMIRDCGYFNNHGVTDHNQLFDLIGKDIRKFTRNEKISLRPLSDYVEELENQTLESLRMDSEYMAKLAMQDGNDFYNAKNIANSLGIFEESSKEYALIQQWVWGIYNRHNFSIFNNKTKLES